MNMYMPPPLAAKSYAKISGVITTCLQSIAKESMSKSIIAKFKPEYVRLSDESLL